MTTIRKIKRTLDVFNLESIEGSGDKLVVVLQAERTTAAGTPERYELRLGICRFGVRDFLNQLAAMHVRDRKRINEELARIAAECQVLKVPQ